MSLAGSRGTISPHGRQWQIGRCKDYGELLERTLTKNDFGEDVETWSFITNGGLRCELEDFKVDLAEYGETVGSTALYTIRFHKLPDGIVFISPTKHSIKIGFLVFDFNNKNQNSRSHFVETQIMLTTSLL